MVDKREEKKAAEKKGRPTPKRKEAEQQRTFKRLAPAATKEAKKIQKQQARLARVAQRDAYMRGEESALPLRDRGPVRRFVRDFVDSRRSVGEYFLPVIVIVLIMTVIPVLAVQLGAIVLMYSVLAFSIVDGFFLSRRIKREVAKRFPNENSKGLGMYGWLRSTQIRKLRAPQPKVKRGAAL